MMKILISIYVLIPILLSIRYAVKAVNNDKYLPFISMDRFGFVTAWSVAAHAFILVYLWLI